MRAQRRPPKLLPQRAAGSCRPVDQSHRTFQAPFFKGNRMSLSNRNAALLSLLALACSTAFAAQPIVYPAKGQTPELQQKDQAECDAWAVRTTGVDPRVTRLATPERASASTSQHLAGRRRTRARCGARGGRWCGDRRHCRRYRQGGWRRCGCRRDAWRAAVTPAASPGTAGL